MAKNLFTIFSDRSQDQAKIAKKSGARTGSMSIFELFLTRYGQVQPDHEQALKIGRAIYATPNYNQCENLTSNK